MASKKILAVWAKGPSLGDLCDRHEIVLNRLYRRQKANEYWISLRQASAVLKVSHHTLSSWIEQDLIRREGRKRRFRIKGLISFVKRIGMTHARVPAREERFGKSSLGQNDVLRRAKFHWPPDQETLSPRELASRIGCHSSTIRRAIHSIYRLGRLRARTKTRWEISRNKWKKEFPNTIAP